MKIDYNAYMRFGNNKITRRRLRGAGEIILFVYLLLVIIIAILERLVGWPSVSQLASSPSLLMSGQWWRIITSGLVIQGPAVPQILAIAVLGTVGIYMGGSWLFWRTAVTGHVVGTLVAYAGFSALWLMNHAAGAQFVTNPDYGVSLVWCAGLGAFAALCWLGARKDWRQPVHPIPVVLAIAVMIVVTAYSDDMAAVQHLVAFLVGLVIIATADRSKSLSKSRQPLGANLAHR
jgi:membrane associated rhomboid family serine protease